MLTHAKKGTRVGVNYIHKFCVAFVKSHGRVVVVESRIGWIQARDTTHHITLPALLNFLSSKTGDVRPKAKSNYVEILRSSPAFSL